MHLKNSAIKWWENLRLKWKWQKLVSQGVHWREMEACKQLTELLQLFRRRCRRLVGENEVANSCARRPFEAWPTDRAHIWRHANSASTAAQVSLQFLRQARSPFDSQTGNFLNRSVEQGINQNCTTRKTVCIGRREVQGIQERKK